MKQCQIIGTDVVNPSCTDGPILSSAAGYVRAEIGLSLMTRPALTAVTNPMPTDRRQTALRHVLKQCEMEGIAKSLLVAVYE